MNDSELIKAVLAKNGTPCSGTFEEDLEIFAEWVLAEKKRREDLQRAREICLAGGGHFFSFFHAPSTGEWWVIENEKTTISGWKGCDIKCDHCDACLVISYEEKDV